MKRRSARPRAASRHTPAASNGTPWFSLHGTPVPSDLETWRLTRLAWAIAGALVVALLLVVLGPHRIGDYFTETDFYGAYAEGARMIQHGILDPSRYGVIGPGYEIALAVVGFVVRDLFFAAELISVAATVAVLMLWFDIARRLTGARVAIFATLFIVTNKDFFRYGFSATTDAFGLAIQAAALWLLLAGGGRARTWGAGIVAALAFLTRYNAVYLLPAGLVILIATTSGARARFGAAAAFVAGFAIPVAPWLLFSAAHGGAPGLELHHNIAFEVFARPKGIVWDDYQKFMQPQFKSLWDVIARDPGAVASRMLFNVHDHLRLDAGSLLGWPVAIAAAVGVLFTTLSGAWRRLWPLAVAGALLFLTLVPVFHSARYSLGLLPIYAVLAGATFGLPTFALALGRSRRIWVKVLVAAVPLAFAVSDNVVAQANNLRLLPREVLDCARTLRALAASGDKIIARKPHIAYYSGLQALPFPFADSLAQLANYAKSHGARWMFVSWPEVEMRPRFWPLLDTSAVLPGLTVRRATQEHPAVVYEIGPAFGTVPAWWKNDTLRSWHTARAQLMVDPNMRDALYALGQIESMRGHMAQAESLLTRLVRIDPDNFSAQLVLGDAAMRLGHLDLAARSFGRAMQLRPASVAARIGMGWVHVAAGRDREAAQYWRPIIASTDDPSTLSRMATLFRSLNDSRAAEQAATRLRSLEDR